MPICVHNAAGLLACCGFHLWKVHHFQDHCEGNQHVDEERFGRLVDALRLLSGPACLSRLWPAQGSHTCMLSSCLVCLERPCNQPVVLLCCDCSFQCLIHQSAALYNGSVQLYKVIQSLQFSTHSADLTACHLRSVAELLHVPDRASLVSVQYNRHHSFNDQCLLRVS